MLILSTYRVVLHPSYLQKVFYFIIFIKERYSFTILSEKSRAPGGTPWAELKSDEHLSADRQQNTDIWWRFTYHLQFWIMTGIFYSWDCSILFLLSLSRFAITRTEQHSTVLTTYFTRLDVCQWCSGSANHSPSSYQSSLLTLFMW